MVTAPVSCANDEFRVANSEVPRINARDQFAENFRCLCQGIRGVLDDCKPGCATGIIHLAPSVQPQPTKRYIKNSRLGSRADCSLARRIIVRAKDTVQDTDFRRGIRLRSGARAKSPLYAPAGPAKLVRATVRAMKLLTFPSNPDVFWVVFGWAVL